MLGPKLDPTVHLRHELALNMEAEYLVKETVLANLHLLVKSCVSIQVKQLLANIGHQLIQKAVLGQFSTQLVDSHLFEVPLSHEPLEPVVHTAHVVVFVHHLVVGFSINLYRL